MSAAGPLLEAAAAPLPGLDRAAISRLLDRARFRREGVLLDHEAMALLDAIGLSTPHRIELAGAAEAAGLDDPPLRGPRLVLKLASPDLTHKTEAGGVRILDNRRDAVVAAVTEMEHRFAGSRVAGFTLYEFVPHEKSPGHELLLGVRWSREFGPIVTLGPGGVHAEFMARALREDEGLAILTPQLSEPERIPREIARAAVARLATEPQRGLPAPIPPRALAAWVERLLDFARDFVPDPVAEFEANPVVVSHDRLRALDARLRFSRAIEEEAPARPIGKIANLLAPRSIAVVGASERMNPGRVILRNILRQGFPPARVTVVKPGLERLDDCRCVPSLDELPGRADLVVLSVPAAQSAELTARIAERDLADSVILIASGLEERSAATGPLALMHQALRRSRASASRGPVVNGGNCLGIRSVPGRYDTLFIPSYKLPAPAAAESPVALLAASGAFAVSKSSKLAGLTPRYLVTLGNQTDLTVSDYLEHLAGDPAVEVFAVYLEGFRLLDGARFLRITREITRGGRTVILYRAGRTPAGADAAASHTAVVAGDYRVARALAAQAGAVVADSLEDFEDLVRIFTAFRGREVRGRSLAAASNAGYECVAIADGLSGFRLAEWSAVTRARLAAILERARLGEIVSVRNPIDLTPILGDEGYEEVARAILEDPGVDVGVIGCVPLTPALNTLPAGEGHPDDLAREDGIVRRLIRLGRESEKPWVAVVDAGSMYDPMARALEDGGVPVFRTADRALRLFGRWCEQRLSAGADGDRRGGRAGGGIERSPA